MSNAELGKALAGAFKDIDHAVKNATNPHFKSTYANLAEVLDTIRPVFAKHELSLVQLPGAIRNENGLMVVSLTTTIVHSSGEMLGAAMDIPVVVDKHGKLTAHAIGSAISFARRYAASAMAGISQEDDDGNAGSDGGDEGEGEGTVDLTSDIDACTTLLALDGIKSLVEESGDAGYVAAWKAKRKELKGK